jgi:hypothetical protein
MKNYAVTICAKITKTIKVTAENEMLASEYAHQLFSVLNDSRQEKYEQDTVHIEHLDK